MNDDDDATLLRLYADEGSEPAFTELVRRHVNLVYGASLRRTGGDAHRAADVAQHVFTALARDARRLSGHTVLEAWLHTATRNASLNLMASEHRRKTREAEAVRLEASLSGSQPDPDWERIRPLLDGAIDELPEADRAAVVLRFLEHREFSEIGLALRVSADAARMRTERALDKLRAMLARRGVTSTAAALGAVVANQPLVSAPAGIASALAAASLAGGAAGLAAPLTTLMTTKTITTALVTGIVAFGIGAYYGGAGRPAAAPIAERQNPQQAIAIAALRKSNADLQADLDRVDAANELLTAANAKLKANLAELAAAKASAPATPPRNLSIGMSPRELKQTIMSNLRQIDAARAQYRLEKNADPSSVEDLVGDGGYIRRLRTVGGEDYSGLSMGAGQLLTVTTPDGTVVTYDPSGAQTTQITEPPTPAEHAQELMQSVAPALQQALAAYRAGNQGQNPPSPEALTPYFTNPQDAAAFAQARDAMKAAQAPPH
jgi:RNA polymerase sigma factor (sigma-70 family)